MKNRLKINTLSAKNIFLKITALFMVQFFLDHAAILTKFDVFSLLISVLVNTTSVSIFLKHSLYLAEN